MEKQCEGSCRYAGIILRRADIDWWVMALYLDQGCDGIKRRVC